MTFETMRYTVRKLFWVRIGILWLGDLESDYWSLLTPPEVAMLLGEATPAKKRAAAPASARRGDASKERRSGGGKDTRATGKSEPGVLPGARAKRRASPLTAPVGRKKAR